MSEEKVNGGLLRAVKKIGIYPKLKEWKENLIDTKKKSWRISHEKKLKLYSNFIKKGDLVFDIGANFGDRTQVFLELGARVIAVEPVECCVNHMNKKFINKDVKVIKSAVGSANGETIINVCPASAFSTLSREYLDKVATREQLSDLDWNEKQKVDIITLDTLISKYGVPDFIKIDVEGYEYEVLKGLSHKIKSMSIEFNMELLDVIKNSILKLSTLGKYEFNISLQETMKLLLENWKSSKVIYPILSELNKSQEFGDVYARLK